MKFIFTKLRFCMNNMTVINHYLSYTNVDCSFTDVYHLFDKSGIQQNQNNTNPKNRCTVRFRLSIT